MAITQQPSADIIHKPRVNFDKERFTDAIDQKGYEVYLENAFRCPCIADNAGGSSPLSNCKNCGGLGWFYVNKRETKMVLSAMNIETQYKEWTEEKIGTAKITAKDEDDLSFMDRITLRNSTSIHKEVLEPYTDENDQIYFKTTYDIVSVKQIFRYRGPNYSLVRQGDTTEDSSLITIFNGNSLIYSPTIENTIGEDEPYPFKIAIFYEHRPQFYTIDIIRDIMTTRVFDENSQGKIEPKNLPVHAIGRRSHFVFDDVQGGLADNSWLTEFDYNGANC